MIKFERVVYMEVTKLAGSYRYVNQQHNIRPVIFVQDIQRHVLGRLRSLLFGNEADAESTGEVLEYFMRRLSSVQTAERDSAVKVHYNGACYL